MKKYYLAISLLFIIAFSLPVSAAESFKIKADNKITYLEETKDLTDEYSMPWGLRRLSPVWQYNVSGGEKYSLTLSYKEASAPGTNELKAVFFYDKTSKNWKLMGGTDSPTTKEMKVETKLGFAPVAVFSYPLTKSIGQATWYSYKKGDFAASPDFPKGTKLKVTNTANNKSVVVTVNDYGPDRRLFPQRVIDLDKVAFKKIAATSAGVINVKVEPVTVASQGSIFPTSFKPKSRAAALYDTKNKQWLYEYNGDAVMPLASLSKVAAVKVFVDIPGNRERLNEVVDYQYADEAYNYKYCSVWESARLRMKTNDTLTIRDLIYSALVGSANNAVESLVRHSGLSREEFIAQMNTWVQEQGLEHTHFEEPTGLSPQNVTTAKEYALLSSLALTDPLVAVPASSWTYSFKNRNDASPHNLKNTNPLLGSFKYSFFASKTGYLYEAAHCLMMGAHGSKTDVIAVVLGASTQGQSIADMESLLKYGLVVSK